MTSFPHSGSDPPENIARPKAETLGAGKASGLDARLNSSLLPASPNRKRYHSPFRAQLAGTLVQELNPWIENLVVRRTTGQSARNPRNRASPDVLRQMRTGTNASRHNLPDSQTLIR